MTPFNNHELNIDLIRVEVAKMKDRLLQLEHRVQDADLERRELTLRLDSFEDALKGMIK